MKSADFIKELSGMTKIPADKLKEIFTSTDEVEVEFNKPHIYSEDELETLKTNIKKESGRATLEMGIKEQRNFLVETFGDEFNFQGKTMENLIEAAIKAGEKKAGVKPNEQIAEKEKMIKNLQDAVRTLETEKKQVIDDKNNVLMEYEINSTITKSLPKDIDTLYSPEDLLVLYKKDRQVLKEEGKTVIKKNGEVLRDKTQEPISVETDFTNWLVEKGVKRTAQGRGDGDKKQSGPKDYMEINSMGDFHKYAEENNIPRDKQLEMLQKIFAENPNFKE